MKKHIHQIYPAGILAAAMLAMPTATLAQDVTLHSHDGSAHIDGDLITFKDGTYKLWTALGVLHISAKLVSCDGVTCPSDAMVMSDLFATGDVLIYDNTSTTCPLTSAVLTSDDKC